MIALQAIELIERSGETCRLEIDFKCGVFTKVLKTASLTKTQE